MTKAEREGDRTRMAIIETDIKYIKKTLDGFSESIKHTDKKIDTFIDSANKIYATKLELDNIRMSLKSHEQKSTDWIKSVIPWLLASAMFIIALIQLIMNGRGGA